MTRSAVASSAKVGGSRRALGTAAEQVFELPDPVRRASSTVTSAPMPMAIVGGVRADDAAAEDHQHSRPHAGRAAEQDAPAAVRLSRRRRPAPPCARRPRSSARAAAGGRRRPRSSHRRSRSRPPSGALGLGRVGGEVEVGEEDRGPASEGRTPRRAAPSPSAAARCQTNTVEASGISPATPYERRESRSDAGPVLDEDLMAAGRSSRAPAGVRATRPSATLVSFTTPTLTVAAPPATGREGPMWSQAAASTSAKASTSSSSCRRVADQRRGDLEHRVAAVVGAGDQAGLEQPARA